MSFRVERPNGQTHWPKALKINFVTTSNFELEITVIVTVVGGKQCVRKHLAVLCPQVNFERAEILVPYDNWTLGVGELAAEFPLVDFHFSGDMSLPDPGDISKSDHHLYDRRRAIGLRLARGKIIAMTEDQAVPANDWVTQVFKAHERSYEVIGGAVENGVDRPMNRALYFCDFGRYGRPFRSGEVSYVSDVNLAYKRAALARTRNLWIDEYHETTVNWALQSLGEPLYLDNGPVVYECRPVVSFWKAVIERVAWGRVFATTRVGQLSSTRRIFFVGGTFFLPAFLFFRALKHMTRQGLGTRKILETIPFISIFVIFWSIGELLGYLAAGSDPKRMFLSTSIPPVSFRSRGD